MVNKSEVMSIAKKFAEELQKQFKIDAVYLFGSHAAGFTTEYSDIDIAIVSDDFIGIAFDDRIKINPIILRINSNIEPHPFKTSDFNPGSNPFVEKIIKTSIRIV